ncbi:MAG TPA: amino acid adenylation domain-containing protein [Pyrinomonadaceae bacterium]|nr:amino acid adenylation domain-containing protein [Pyrinomonadaceae bacterium]
MLGQIEGYRLSPLQKQLWLLQQDGSPYRSQCAIRIEGPLDELRLRKALKQIVDRHEILRTTFHRVPGIKFPMQAIGETADPSWISIDLSGRSDKDQQAEIERCLAEDRQMPVNYEQGSLLRTTLISFSAEQHVLILSVPSLCADNRSLNNLVLEIAGSYADAPERNAGDDVVQYLQFSEWQNEVIADENGEPGREYWRQQNIIDPAALTLPFENTQAEALPFEPRSIHTAMAPEVVAKLKPLAADLDTTIATILSSCWQALLWRLTGHSDIVIGNVDDGRKYDELQGAIGLLARALPVSTHFADNSFAAIVQDVSCKVREAHDWLEYFTWEQSSEQDEAFLSAPFFSTAFEFISLAEPVTAGGLTFSVDRQHSCFDRFKVKLNCIEQGEMVQLDWQYDAQRFRQEDVEQLAAQFDKLLAGVIADPRKAVGEIEIVSDAEWQRLIVELNQTERNYPKDKCVHELFAEQAARTPELKAVVFEDESLTFAELNARANQLANYLQSQGVGPETTVAIYTERSLEMIVAVLGTLKAGGAYVPLDLAYPKDRLAFMLSDANISVLLTHERLVGRIPEHEAREVTLDSDWPVIATESDVNPVSRVDMSNAAYVIYTSGSTGTPKGVICTHYGLNNYLNWCAEAYGVNEGAGAPVHSPLGFDLTITSIFPPLLAGKSVVLVSEDKRFAGLSSVLSTGCDFSLVKITPSHLEVLNQMLTPGQMTKTTRALIIGGEALNSETLSAWRTVAPGVRLINEYGPTETVVGCCVYEVAPEDPDNGPVPIGRAIANTQLYLLDKFLHPVPAGVTGELYIGGDGLARGYLGRPELTAARFLPNPFGTVSGTRLYRTGDLARYRRDGVIEYLGRSDQQVKIRGFRVELGEIESALNRHPKVAEAVVMVRQDVPGDTRLAAYLVPHAGQEVAINEVRTFLRELLPEYMVPTFFLTLRAFPLTPNGKINRQALPVPETANERSEEAHVAPRTALEEIIAAIWSEIIGVKRIGVHDSFFELGGHSLLAMQVISRIREEFEVDIPVRSLFDGMTVENLAATVLEREPEAGRSEKIARTLKAVAEMPEEELLKLISAQKGQNEN